MNRCLKLLCLLLLPLGLGGCGVLDQGVFGAAGPVAAGERHLLMVVLVVMLFVIGPVILLTPVFAWHYRLANRHNAYRPNWVFSWPLEGLIWIPPTLIVVGLSVLVWRDTHRFDPYRPLAASQPVLEVQAVGLDFRWLFIYPALHVASLNQLAVPAGRPVHLSLTSATVMQSMLIPRLAGQIYAMAGMTTQLNLAADQPGQYLGENTQFNGMGFQTEKFTVQAMPAAAFDGWVAQARAGGRTLDTAGYAALIRPTPAAGPILFGSVQPGLFGSILAQFHADAGGPQP